MAVQFPDLNPTATSNDKNVHSKTIRLLSADVTTAGANSVKLVLASDATILAIRYWKKTQFSGGGVTAVTLSIGIPGTPTNFVNAIDILTPVAGTIALFTPVTNIMQNYGIPFGPDIQLLFTGTATTGNPTAGEFYVTVDYVR